jgi:hypothetical protein
MRTLCGRWHSDFVNCAGLPGRARYRPDLQIWPRSLTGVGPFSFLVDRSSFSGILDRAPAPWKAAMSGRLSQPCCLGDWPEHSRHRRRGVSASSFADRAGPHPAVRHDLSEAEIPVESALTQLFHQLRAVSLLDEDDLGAKSMYQSHAIHFSIKTPVADAHAFIADPRNYPRWAAVVPSTFHKVGPLEW